MPYQNQNNDTQQVLRNLTRLGVRFLGKKALAPFLPIILIIGGSVFAVLFFSMLAYATVFLVPQQIAEESMGKVRAFFNLSDSKATAWTEEDDEALYIEYTELADSWKEGLDEFQQEQAEDYALPWAVLAAVDRVFGDPSINLNIKDEVDYKPEAKKHYEILKPIFEWKDSTIIRELEWEEEVEVGEDDEGNPIYETQTMHSTEREEVKLLTLADTYEATYVYEYETVTNTWTEGGTTITETKEVVKNIIEHGPYYQRLLILLDEHGLKESEIEMVLELATVYDKDYQHSLDNRWVEINSFALDYTQSYYDGRLGTVVWPLPGNYTRVSSGFGWRIHPIRNKRSFHTGIDWPAPKGTPVYAVTDGYVRFSGNNGAYGQSVIIEHGEGIFTAYAHLSKRLVHTGDLVSCGDEIGLVGSTGMSTGSHLHFEARKVVNGAVSYFNPLELFNLPTEEVSHF